VRTTITAAALTAARHASGITQAELGTRIYRTNNTISRWERGTTPIPRSLYAALERHLDPNILYQTPIND